MELKAKTDYFFPRQIWKDVVGMAVVFACISGLAFWEPVVLLDEATPDPGDYHPEPEWYFLFLFQHLRLRMFSGEVGQIMASIVLPGLLGLMLVFLPFFDRNPERNIFKRPFALIGWVVLMASILLFTVSAIINRDFLD
jgi:ubiquinol-cytochrome c reductase cytochrome b subunit